MPKTQSRSKGRQKSTGARSGNEKRSLAAAREGSNNATGDEQKWLAKNEEKLSRTTLRAKWIHSPEEHADRAGQTLVTRDHDVIKAWAGERNAEPATVESTRRGSRAGVLRFRFRGNEKGDNSRLQDVDWNTWFRTFDEREVAMLFQEKLRNGNQSNFFRFDSPHREDA